MSNENHQNLSSVDVVKETLEKIGDVYFPLLIINLPDLVFSLIEGFSEVSYLLVISVILSLWYTATGYIYYHKVLNEQNITIGRAFKASLSKIGNVLIAIIIISLIVFIGFLLFIIQGIYIANRLYLTLYVIVIENCSVIQGIKRSWELTKGHSRFIFLTLGQVIGIPILIVWIVFLIIFRDVETVENITNLLGSVIRYLWSPILFVSITLVYNRLIASYKSAK